ncbi:MAG: MerR family transcriptional regulator [Actinoallomurus sp.]
MDGPWTLAELTAKATSVLSDGRAPQPGGRVRDLPNERTIRWYVTIGLVDPPLSRRGRVAVYGPRHLLQLVAVKRRQAEGRSLADIQAELAGAPDATLRAIARLDAAVAGPAGGDEAAPRPSGSPSSPDPDASRPAPPGASRSPAATRRFWAEHPAPQRPASPPERPTGGSPADASRRTETDALVRGVRLAPGVTLLLDASPSPDDAAAIVAAAAPLIDLLTERGLL